MLVMGMMSVPFAERYGGDPSVHFILAGHVTVYVPPLVRNEVCLAEAHRSKVLLGQSTLDGIVRRTPNFLSIILSEKMPAPSANTGQNSAGKLAC